VIVINGPIKTPNGTYLTAVNGGGLGGPDAGTGLVALHSDATAASTWETFTLVLSPAGQKIGPGMTFGLITSSGKNYVTAVNGGGISGPNDGTCPFHTDAKSASGWEQFTLNVNDAVNPPTVTIQTANGNYVTAVDGGGIPDSPGGDNATPVRTSDGALQAWQTFTAAGGVHPLPQPAKYNFELNSLQVLSKRTNTFPGTGEDTDFVGFTLTVGNNAPQTITKAMGNLSTNSYNIGLVFEGVAVNPGDNVIFNYHIVNSGQPEAKALAYLEQTLQKVTSAGITALAEAGAAALGALIGSLLGLAIPVPLLGSALGALGGLLLADAWGFLFPNCDGPVAAALHIWSSAYLTAVTSAGTFTNTENHPGVNSPSGCGGNSNYNVTWSITPT
jgi:hypothetical protein